MDTNSKQTQRVHISTYRDDFAKLACDLLKNERIEPLKASGWIIDEARRLEKEFSKDGDLAVIDLFKRIKVGGEYGFCFDMSMPRKDGQPLIPEQIGIEKKAYCLEFVNMFISICEQAGLNKDAKRALAFNVAADESGAPLGHVCAGFLTTDKRLARYAHPLFALDKTFRCEVLAVSKLEDNPDLALVLIDLSIPIGGLGVKFTKIKALSASELFASYLNNSGTGLLNQDQMEKGLKQLSIATKLRHPFAISNLTQYYLNNGDLQKIIDITDACSDILDSHSNDARLFALLRTGTDFGKLELAALKVIQKSRESIIGYYILGLCALFHYENYEKADKAFSKCNEIIKTSAIRAACQKSTRPLISISDTIFKMRYYCIAFHQKDYEQMRNLLEQKAEFRADILRSIPSDKVPDIKFLSCHESIISSTTQTAQEQTYTLKRRMYHPFEMMQLINLTFLIGDYEKAQKLFDSYSASMPEWSQNLLLSLLTREQKGAKKYPGNPEIFLTVAVAQYMLENGKAPLLDFVILPEDSISCNATCCVRDAKICKFKTATPTRIITFLYGEDTYVGIVHHLDQGIRAGNLPFIFRKIIPNNGHNTLIRCLRAFSEENFKEAVPLINVVSAYFPNNPQIDEFRTELLKLCRQLGIN